MLALRVTRRAPWLRTAEEVMPKRVLVVDDDAASRTDLQALLEGQGYQAEAAAGGAEALEKVRSFRPAVVIADLVMPGMDGLELVRSLQDEAPFAVTILLTGKGSIETAVQAMKAGAYDYLTKPVDLDHLMLLWPRRSCATRRDGTGGR